MLTYHGYVQLLGVTGDNAANNDTMIASLADINDGFPGAANQVRCLAHTLNLVAKGTTKLFDTKNGLGDEAVAAELAIPEDLEDMPELGEVDEEDDDDFEDVGSEDGDGLTDVDEDLSEEEQEELREGVLPLKLVLAKVSTAVAPF